MGGPEIMPNEKLPPILFLEGRRIYLRPLEMSDERLLRQWFAPENTRENLERYWPITQAFEQRFIETNGTDETSFAFAIVLKIGDRPIGVTGFRGIRWKDRTAEFGITVGDSKSRNQGLGSEATVLLLHYLFRTLNMNRIQLGVWDFNTAAIRSYEKIGFTLEGRQRQHGFVRGRYVDHLIYGMLAAEFEAKYPVERSLPDFAPRATRRRNRGSR
ncbi:MAG: GNAT family N-acetyltransferase [Phycisphaerae bacterium]|nr:GNAT family N-acetyltransferase [Phycisphaerae bacterium]